LTNNKNVTTLKLIRCSSIDNTIFDFIFEPYTAFKKLVLWGSSEFHLDTGNSFNANVIKNLSAKFPNLEKLEIKYINNGGDAITSISDQNWAKLNSVSIGPLNEIPAMPSFVQLMMKCHKLTLNAPDSIVNLARNIAKQQKLVVQICAPYPYRNRTTVLKHVTLV